MLGLRPVLGVGFFGLLFSRCRSSDGQMLDFILFQVYVFLSRFYGEVLIFFCLSCHYTVLVSQLEILVNYDSVET